MQGDIQPKAYRWAVAIAAGFALGVIGLYAARIFEAPAPVPALAALIPGVLAIHWLRPR